MDILSESQIKSIIKIALEAGEIAMHNFGGDNLNITKKSDDSPLTIADSLISELIYRGLKKILPDIPIICEEGENRDFGAGTFWLIDPIDGTISFANNDPEFTINIALIKDQKPIFGLIFAPAIIGSPFYFTDKRGALLKYSSKSKEGEIFVSQRKIREDFVVLSSKRSSDSDILDCLILHSKMIQKSSKALVIKKASSSLKFLYLIEGKADLYLHLRRSMEWDIAAGNALLEAAGGEVVNLDGSRFLYKKSGLANQPFLARINDGSGLNN